MVFILFNITKEIYDTLSSIDGLKVFTDETDTSSAVWLQFGLENGSSYRIKFISTDDDNDVAIRVFSIVSVTEDQVAKVLPVLNELNCKYRYAKFTCDDDRDINLEYDFPAASICPEKSAKEMLIRFNTFVEEAYPLIMRTIWA